MCISFQVSRKYSLSVAVTFCHIAAVMTSLLFQGTNDLPVEPTQPQRGASLTRFREKRKERCFDMKICYTQVRVSAVIIDLKDDSINGERKKVNLHHPRLVLMMNVVSRFGSFGKEVSHQVIEFESPASSGATQGSIDGEAKGSDVIAMVTNIAPSAVNGDNSGMTVGRKL
ncbi:uncharacterized protein [Pyrus communis]|uniref:uncharacterized protein n=1 Tax=Pyrus communis TaxID=23211 RepID=UPI0035C08301